MVVSLIKLGVQSVKDFMMSSSLQGIRGKSHVLWETPRTCVLKTQQIVFSGLIPVSTFKFCVFRPSSMSIYLLTFYI